MASEAEQPSSSENEPLPELAGDQLERLRRLAARERGSSSGNSTDDPEDDPSLDPLSLFELDRDEIAQILANSRTDDRSPVGSESPQDRIGPFRLIRELGAGGQGIVYLAVDTRLDRNVALKLLPAVRGKALERLRREANLASRVNDPGVCPIYELGEDSGVPYLAMRYVEGESLADLLATARKEHETSPPLRFDGENDLSSTQGSNSGSGSDVFGPGSPEVAAVLRFFSSLARSLHVAHETGLVHRDIKPGNVIRTPEGQAVILDFGLAREEGLESSLTGSGDVVGTPAYLSPDQIQNAPEVLDRRTDVWSLGVTLYECFTLRRPFDAPTRERLYREILESEPTPIRRHATSATRDLDVVLSTALAKNPARRYATAAALADDLDRVLRGEPVLARPVPTIERALRWAFRHRAVAGLTLLLFVVLIAALGVSLSFLKEARHQNGVAIEALKEKDSALRQAFIDQAWASRSSTTPGRRFTGLDALRSAAAIRGGRDARDETINSLSLADMRIERRETDFPENTRLVAFDAGHERYVRAAKAEASLHLAKNDEKIRSIDFGLKSILSLYLSPDGSHSAAIATSSDGDSTVVVCENEQGVPALPSIKVSHRAVDFSDDSQLFAAASQAGGIEVWELKNRRRVWTATATKDPYNLKISPNADRVAVSSRDYGLVDVLDLSSNSAPIRYKVGHSARTIAWGPSGR
ncbi:MAG: WD40 repeat domain-containing serine/threonine protein kinase, partial [Planctomycetota bacterium]